MFDENNEETANITNVAWIDTSVSAKPILCRIREAMSRLAYLSFLIGFGKYSGVLHKLELAKSKSINVRHVGTVQGT